MPIKTLTATLAVLLGTSGLAAAQSAADYPNDTVRFIVPYSPSGSTDPAARFIAGQLGELWGQNVVVENQPGAGATIGTATVAQADPDGYTLLLTTSAYTTSPSVYDDLPYDPLEDLEPVAMPARAQFVVTAGANVEADDLEGFLAEAAEREIFLATAGLGTSTHFAGELFTQATGINAVPVHYKGGSNAMVDLMGGRADIYVGSMAAVIGNVRGGEIKALAVLGDERADALPDTPTTAEAGFDDASSGFWLGVFAPGGTPDEIVQKLNDDIISVMQSEAGQAYLDNLNSTLDTMEPAEFEELVAEEIEQWKSLADGRGIAAN